MPSLLRVGQRKVRCGEKGKEKRTDNESRESTGEKSDIHKDVRLSSTVQLFFNLLGEKQSYSLKLSFILFCKTPSVHSTVSQTC